MTRLAIFAIAVASLLPATAVSAAGMLQWTYDGHPLYYYDDDKKAGDVTGDGKGGVWHVVKG